MFLEISTNTRYIFRILAHCQQQEIITYMKQIDNNILTSLLAPFSPVIAPTLFEAPVSRQNWKFTLEELMFSTFPTHKHTHIKTGSFLLKSWTQRTFMYSVMAMGMSLWLWDFPFTIKHKAVNVYRHRILRPAVLFLHFQHQVQTFLIDKWKEFTCSFTEVYKVSFCITGKLC